MKKFKISWILILIITALAAFLISACRSGGVPESAAPEEEVEATEF